MRTIIFSDTHLGLKFIPRKFEYLKKIISNSDRVIINGDFWDNVVSVEKFTNSKWRELFPLLKKKETIYIYGNHDEAHHWNKTIKEFSKVQTYEYRLEGKNETYIVTHGHKITPTMQSRYFDKKYKKIIPKVFWGTVRKLHKTIYKIYYHINFDKLGSFLFKEGYYRPFKYQNEKMKRYAKNNLSNSEILICGHSHKAEIDIENKFANDGLINHELAQYLSIENGKIRLVKERY